METEVAREADYADPGILPGDLGESLVGRIAAVIVGEDQLEIVVGRGFGEHARHRLV